MQQTHEQDAGKVGLWECLTQEVCHQRHPPAVLGDALLPTALQPSMPRALFERCDAVQDG